jgi:hypothetical protein
LAKENILNLEIETAERNKVQKYKMAGVEDVNDSLTKELSSVRQKLEDAQALNQNHDKVIWEMKESIATAILDKSDLSEQLSLLKRELESAAKREIARHEAKMTFV